MRRMAKRYIIQNLYVRNSHSVMAKQRITMAAVMIVLWIYMKAMRANCHSTRRCAR